MFDLPTYSQQPRWNELIEELDRRVMPDGDLAGWFFHGLPAGQLYGDRYHDGNGVLTDGLVPRPVASATTDYGTHLGTPRVAGYFAEHRTMKGERPCLLAMPPEAIDANLLEPDIFMIQMPVIEDNAIPDDLCTRAEHDVSVCWHSFGSLIYPRTLEPQHLIVLQTFADLEQKLPEPEASATMSP